MPDSDPSPGEIGRNLVLIREDLKGLKESVEQRPDWNDLRDTRATLEDKIKAEETIRELQRVVADKAIKALEDWNLWATRLVLGGVITGTLGAAGVVAVVVQVVGAR